MADTGLGKAEINCETGALFCQAADSAAIQCEIDALVAEAGNITTNTKFNDIDVFGWDRERVQFQLDPAANTWVSVGTSQTSTVAGNNYGLTEVVGKDHIWFDSHLSDELQFTSDGSWHSTGKTLYNSQTIESVQKEIKEISQYGDNIQFEVAALPPDNQTVINDTANGYRITVTYDPDLKTLDDQYVAKSIQIDKGSYDDNNDFIFEKSYHSYKISSRGENLTGYDNGKAYAAAWIDFSGLGKDYDISSLIGQGFNSQCATCARHYSITFTDQAYENGLNYRVTGTTSSPCLEINISGCDSGEKLVETIMEAVENSPYFYDHYTQYAYNDAEPAKLYIYDNGDYIYDSPYKDRSKFEPAMRNGQNQLVVADTVLTDTNNPRNRWVYIDKNMWIQSGSMENSGFFIGKPRVTPSLPDIDTTYVMSRESASEAITTCDFALGILNDQRTKMGVQQNRMEKAAAVDANTGENTQAAESRLRDADMAEEMVEYARHNILEQVGQSMLAQTNQSKQGILTLLQ